MGNVRKIKIKLENIWIDLIRSIYAPYMLPPSLFAIHALKGVTAIGAEVEVLQDIQREFHDGEKEESVVKAVEELWKGHSRLVQAVE